MVADIRSTHVALMLRDLTVKICKATCMIDRVTMGDTDVVVEPIIPDFSRASTSNDRGGSGSSFAGRWLNAGLERLTPETTPDG